MAEGLDWIPSKYNGSYGVGIWKFIPRGWDRFFSHIVFEVGNGSSIVFWHGRWCDCVCFRDRFPSLYVLSGMRIYLIIWSTLLLWLFDLPFLFIQPSWMMIVFIIFSPCLIQFLQRPSLLIRLGGALSPLGNSLTSLISFTFLRLLAIRPRRYQIATSLEILSGSLISLGPL